MSFSLDVGLMPRLPARDAVALAQHAERLGFGGVWIADSQSTFREAFTLLGACAVTTQRVLLTTGVTNPITRAPAVLASAFATLDELAPGRIVVGIGKGDTALRTLGQNPPRLSEFEESISELRRLLSGDGDSFQWGPRPLPVYVTASGPRALRLAGRVGDGVLFQVGAHPRLVAHALREIEVGARESGRDLADVVVCARVACSVGKNRAAAIATLGPYIQFALNTIRTAVPITELPVDPNDEAGLADAAVIAGTGDEVLESLHALAGQGIQRVVAPILGTGREQLEQLGALIPGVAGMT